MYKNAFKNGNIVFFHRFTQRATVILFGSLLLWMCCFDLSVVHCTPTPTPTSTPSEFIDFKTLVEITSHATQFTDRESFAEKAQEILGQPLSSGEVDRLMEVKKSFDSELITKERWAIVNRVIGALFVVVIACSFLPGGSPPPAPDPNAFDPFTYNYGAFLLKLERLVQEFVKCDELAESAASAMTEEGSVSSLPSLTESSVRTARLLALLAEIKRN